MMPTVAKVLLYLGIFAVGFIGVSLWAFWLAVRPPRIAIPGTPGLYRLPAEDVVIETADGLKLSAWFIPAAVADSRDRRNLRPEAVSGGDDTDDSLKEAAVILLHGYPAEKADMLSIAAALYPRFASLLLDMRYFGESEGRATTLGLRERDDLKRAVDFLDSRGFRHIGVFGFSLGGAVGIMTAAEDNRIGAVAAYAAFSDLRTLAYELYSNLWLLKYPLVELMRLWLRAFLGGDPTAISPAAAATKLALPTLIIHSRKDEQIPFAHAERLRQALAGNSAAEFYFIERGRHGELPDDFTERLIRFYSQSLLR